MKKRNNDDNGGTIIMIHSPLSLPYAMFVFGDYIFNDCLSRCGQTVCGTKNFNAVILALLSPCSTLWRKVVRDAK